MNSQLQELYRQAIQSTNSDEYLDMSNKQVQRLILTKYAELIVRECVQKLNTEIDRLCEYKNSLPEYSNHSQREDVDLVVEKCHDNIQMIKQHFGVEE